MPSDDPRNIPPTSTCVTVVAIQTPQKWGTYGGRGITVCIRWLIGENGKSGFECFLEDMGRKPSPQHSLDRWPNPNGNYEPGNCRWATPQEQADNRRKAVALENFSDVDFFAEFERRKERGNDRRLAPCFLGSSFRYSSHRSKQQESLKCLSRIIPRHCAPACWCL